MPKLVIAASRDMTGVHPEASDPRVELWCDNDGTLCAYGYDLDGQQWVHWPGLARFRLNGRADGAVTAIPYPSRRLHAIEDVFRRSVLPLALQVRGREVLHASAVRMKRGAVALCAVSETGKSTLAYGLSRRGYPLWADDAVAFEPWKQEIRVIPLPFQVRLRPTSAAFFGEDGIPHDQAVRCAQDPLPLAALFVLQRISGSDIGMGLEVSRLSGARAFAAALTHAYCFSFQDIERKQRMVRNYLDLISRTPVFELRFQSGLERLSAMLDRIESTVNGLEAVD